MKKIVYKTLIILLATIFWGVAFSLFCNSLVESKSDGNVFYNGKDIPKGRTALLLGTSKYLSWGNENLYYKYRIEAAIKIWEAGKIEFFLISGDNSNKNYNEPQMMKDDLVKLGVPKDRIYLDYAGFRTFDSVVRAKNIFGQEEIVIISQEFHAERALYIADNFGLEAQIFVSKNVSFKYDPKMFFREIAARTLMILDLYLLGTEPKFSGEQINIGLDTPQF